MSGEFLTITLAANETKPFQKAGRYLEIIADGGGTINLTFYGSNGAVASNWLNCQSGTFLEDPWGSFSVTNNSASAQSITLLLMDSGRGGSRRQPGVVSVTNKISSKVQRLELSNGGLLPIGFLATAIITPAQNVNGVLVRNAVVAEQAGAGGTGEIRMVAAPVVPVSMSPTSAFQMAATSGAAGVYTQDVRNDLNYQLPPGWGIWVLTGHTVAAATTCGASLCWEIL